MRSTNPASLTLVSSYDPEILGLTDSITVEGNYAYAYASSLYYLNPVTKVFDISDPAYPVLLTDLTIFPDRYKQLIISGGLFYVVSRDGLLIYDASDPLAPQLLATYPGMESVAAQPQGDTTAYLDLLGFQTVDTSDPAHPIRLGIHAWPQASAFPRSGNYIAASRTNLFTVRNNEAGSFLQVIDVTFPAVINPR